MLIIGIILLNISIFMAAFVFSFNMIINPIEKRDIQVQTLTDENTKLKSDSQLLQDQLDVVQSELDSYKKKYGGSSNSSKSNASGSSSSSKNNSEAEKNLRTEAVLTRQTKKKKITVPQEAEMFLGADQARET